MRPPPRPNDASGLTGSQQIDRPLAVALRRRRRGPSPQRPVVGPHRLELSWLESVELIRGAATVRASSRRRPSSSRPRPPGGRERRGAGRRAPPRTRARARCRPAARARRVALGRRSPRRSPSESVRPTRAIRGRGPRGGAGRAGHAARRRNRSAPSARRSVPGKRVDGVRARLRRPTLATERDEIVPERPRRAPGKLGWASTHRVAERSDQTVAEGYPAQRGLFPRPKNHAP